MEKETTYTGRVAGALDAIPDATTDSTHRKGAAKVIEDDPWAQCKSVEPTGRGQADSPGIASVVGVGHILFADTHTHGLCAAFSHVIQHVQPPP